MQIRCISSAACCLAMIGAAGMAHAASLSNTDKQFLIMAAKTDMIEAHEGQMAENQATRTDEKDFAKTLVKDHTESYEHLTALAAKTVSVHPEGNRLGQRPDHPTVGTFEGQRLRPPVCERRDCGPSACRGRLQTRSGARTGPGSEGLRQRDDSGSGKTPPSCRGVRQTGQPHVIFAAGCASIGWRPTGTWEVQCCPRSSGPES